MRFPREELWVRKAYEGLVRSEKLKVVFRPDDRRSNGNNHKYFHEGEKVTLRVLDKPGDEQRGIHPEFSGLTKIVRIKSISLHKIDELSAPDFCGSSPDVQSQEQLRYHLGLIYNKLPGDFVDTTKLEIEYTNQK